MKIGDKVKRKVYYGAEYGSQLPPEEGIIVYIHPEWRFYTVEFIFRYGTFREAYPLKNRITHPEYEPKRCNSTGPRFPKIETAEYKKKKVPYLRNI